jgi:non-ribosomal peptide synthetase component E (peptide arylation enzyme)
VLVDITIYLPDDLARRAKDQGINLSRMLRDALTARFQEEATVAAVLEGATKIELRIEGDRGNVYTGRITGRKIASGEHVEVFLTDKENVVVYDFDNLKYYVEGEDFGRSSLEDLVGDRDVYLRVMHALGRPATVDLDV